MFVICLRRKNTLSFSDDLFFTKKKKEGLSDGGTQLIIIWNKSMLNGMSLALRAFD